MKKVLHRIKRVSGVGILPFLITVVVVFGLGLLLSSILERRNEASFKLQMAKPIGEWETDPAVWGENFPREYGTWKEMSQTTGRTKYAGDVPFSRLEDDPRNVVLFAGYGFSKEYNEERGHTFAVEDVKKTGRKPVAGTCMTCKSSNVPKLMHDMGIEKFYGSHFDSLRPLVNHPISCLDCHDPKTMELRISRPGLREAFTARGMNIDQATHQEMRTLVCAQCHVEYYFDNSNGKKNYLTFPWKNGLVIDSIVSYYEERSFKDWTHPVSKSSMLKMQHPDYELYSTGIHAYRGVSCADCHMPYMTQGGVKISDHHLKSPLKNIQNSCAVCHRWSEEEVKGRVEKIQDKTRELMDRAEIAIVDAHNTIAQAIAAGVDSVKLTDARHKVRLAQARWDFISAESSMGFHSPQEAARVLGAATDLGRQAQLAALTAMSGQKLVEPMLLDREKPIVAKSATKSTTR
ncbi:MAG: ammonia-forming cytochrome c nitrite reductase subunit c552 [bacterium]|nr:ammonia-forming cytochrome c nitrite reductase subunit c552 [bacterium]